MEQKATQKKQLYQVPSLQQIIQTGSGPHMHDNNPKQKL